MINKDLNISNLIFLDIETAPLAKTFIELPIELQNAWENMYIKSISKNDNISIDEYYIKNASLYPEFLKIMCVVIGYFSFSDKKFYFKIIDEIKYDNEQNILNELKKSLNKTDRKIIAHNGKNFDYPILMKRYIINRILPFNQLLTINAKPWESKLIDSLEIWKFGSYSPNNTTSLDKLCAVFNVPSPKDDICGADIAELYHESNHEIKLQNLKKISKYCLGDIISLAKVVGIMNMQLEHDNIFELMEK